MLMVVGGCYDPLPKPAEVEFLLLRERLCRVGLIRGDRLLEIRNIECPKEELMEYIADPAPWYPND